MSAPGFRKVGFVAGLRWLAAAAELLFAGLGPLAGLAALWLLVSMLAIIPILGQLAIMLITPMLTAGAIAAVSQVSAGRRPAPTLLFVAWGRRDLRARMFALGIFGVFGGILAMMAISAWLVSQVSIEQLQAAQQSPEAMAGLLEQVTLSPLLLVAAGIGTLVMAALYFAIPLVLFHRIGAVAALTASLRSVAANWAAFLGFGLAVIGLCIALGFIFGIVMMLLNLAMGSAGQMITQILFMLVAMLFQVLMASCQWVAFCNVYGSPHEGRGGGTTANGQLLA